MPSTSTTPRHQTSAQARQSAVESDFTPLYAAAGLTDLVAESVKNIVFTTQVKATERLTQLGSKGTEQAKSATTFVLTLPEQVKSLPETTKARIVEAEKQRKELLDEANNTYVVLAGRGKKVIDDTLIAVRKTSAHVATNVEEKLDDVREDLTEAVDPAFEAVQESVTKARRNVTGKAATETVTPRSAAKASAARQVSNAQQAADHELARTKAAAQRETAKAKAEVASAQASAEREARKAKREAESAKHEAETAKRSAAAQKAAATRQSESAKRSAAAQKAAATRKANAAKKALAKQEVNA